MIGIDIGSKFIKICQVEKIQDKFFIVSSGIKENPLSINPKEPDETINHLIKTMLKEASFSTKITGISLGGTNLLTRQFILPSLPEQEIKEAIMLEAQQVIFSSLDSMEIDYQILSNIEGNKIEILFVAAPNQLIDRYVNICEEIKLDLSIIDIDNLCIANSFLALEQKALEQSILILNIGHIYTNMTILDQGKLRFIKNINFGGKNITSEIERYVGITNVQAEELKKNPQYWEKIGFNIKNVLRRSTPDLLEAVYRSIEYCTEGVNSYQRLKKIDKILLTGGTANMEGLDIFLSEILNIKTEKFLPFSNINGNFKKELWPFMSIAFGLAIRGI